MELFKNVTGRRRMPSPDNSRDIIRTYSGKAMALMIRLDAYEKALFFMQRGRESFLVSSALPTTIEGVTKKEGERLLQDMGIELGDAYKNDPVFRQATLPSGWEKISTDDMPPTITRLVDEQGRQRGSVYFDNMPRTRKAHLTLNTRFSVDSREFDIDDEIIFDVLDSGTITHSTNPIPRTGDHTTDVRAENQARRMAIDWLEERYPDWRNPAAYWDETP